jgi:GTP-binding protein Era
MEIKSGFKSGFVTILGRPNVGKSTLLNALLGSKVSIVSNIPQTTRYQIRGILNLENAQIVFVDTPGIHSFKKELVSHLNTVAKKSIESIEAILYVVDVSRSIGREEAAVMEFIARSQSKIIMALNKIDLGMEFLNQYIDAWQKLLKEKNIETNPISYYIPISAKKGKNLDRLVEAILELLPNQAPFYDPGCLSDFPLSFRVADVIREKLFLNLKEELPHSVAVEVAQIEDKRDVIYVGANIYVNRDSQKGIIIGRGGELLKRIGTLARKEIEDILKKRIYLELRVKVLKDWQKKLRILKELGYWYT